MTLNKKNLTSWVELYTEDLLKYARYKISDSEMASDMVQDTFLAAAEKIEGFKGDSSPKTWLFSILNHKIIDYYRKKVNLPIVHETQMIANFFGADDKWQENRKPKEWLADPEEQVLDDPEFHQALQKCLDALPEKWAISVKLKYLLEKRGEEICQELGITASNFWQIIHRAKLQLRECVEKNWFNL